MISETAIFFDLDGTLFDTRKDLAATVNHTRRDLGLKELPTEVVISHVGRGAQYLLEHAISDTDRPIDELWEIFRSHYAEHACESLMPYPGVLETLYSLKCEGYLLGINTNKPNFAVHAILKKFDIANLFGSAVIAGGDGVPLKPDPASLNACAERLGHKLTPADWMIGDSWTDLECAQRAGINSAYCAFGFGDPRTIEYQQCLNSFSDILNVNGIRTR